MGSRPERICRPSTGMTATVLAGLRVVLAVIAAMLLMLSALVLGVVVSTAVLLRQLLGGHRGRMANSGWRGPRTRARPSASQDDVIDVEVREVVTRKTHNSRT